jgi:hypothetical protein
MSGLLSDLLANAVDKADFRITLTRLTILDWLPGPMPETEADRIRSKRPTGCAEPFLTCILRSAEPLRSCGSLADVSGDRRHRWKYLRGCWALIRWWWRFRRLRRSSRVDL